MRTKLIAKILAALLVVGLAGPARADFVSGTATLPSTKRDIAPLPPGADPTRYLAAADYNALMNALLSVRAALINAISFGFTPQASAPTPPLGGSLYQLWVRLSDGHLIYTLSGVDHDLLSGGGGGSGTVTSVGMSVPSFLSVSGSPVTTAGTLAVTLATEAANVIFAGPSSGSAAAPTWRALVAADLPTSGVAAGSCTSCNLTIDSKGRVTAQSSGTGGGFNYQTVSVAGAPLPAEPELNFASGVSCVDNAGLSTDCTVSGGGTIGGSITSGQIAYGDTTSNTIKGTANATLDSSGNLVAASLQTTSANTWTTAQDVAAVALTDGATISTNAALGNTFTVTLGGNRTLANPTNLIAGATKQWEIIQDSTGSRTLGYGSMFKWPGSVAPTLQTAAGAKDLISCSYDGTDLLCGSLAGGGSSSSVSPSTMGFSIVDFSNANGGSLASGGTTVGVSFFFLKPLTLTGFRFYWPGGVGATTVKVSLWDSSGTVVASTASVSVNAAGVYSGTWSSTSIGAANLYKAYVIGMYETGHYSYQASTLAIPGGYSATGRVVSPWISWIDPTLYTSGDAEPATGAGSGQSFPIEPTFTVP